MKNEKKKDFLNSEKFSEFFNTPLNANFSPLNMKERREYPRINANLSCVYYISIPSIKELYSSTGNIRNISAVGVFLCDKPENLAHLSIGDPIKLEFVLQDGHMDAVNVKGRIIRKQENSIAIYGVGIKFRQINKEDQTKIINYVD